MLAVPVALMLLAASPGDAGLPDTMPGTPEDPGTGESMPPRYDSAPLLLDGRVIDFFPDAGTRPPQPAWLRIRGNRVLPEELYRNALALPPDAVPDPAMASYIEETLYGFLVKSGYELATVGAVLTQNGIDVQIDEGQLEKVVFTGRLTFQTLRFRLELFIDQDVFNRPALERQLEVLQKKVGIKVVRWSLMPTPNPEHIGPQLETLGNIEGLQLLHARKRYELWFFFQENEWDTGLGLDVRSGYIDGLELGLNYQGVGFVGDRWRIAASGGAGLHWRIEDHLLQPHFSRAFAEAQWTSRKLGRVRTMLWLTGNLFERQRKDLDLERYREASVIASVHTAIDLPGNGSVTPGIGLQYRRIFGLQPVRGYNPALIPLSEDNQERERVFVELRGNWVFDPENQRWDRRHKIEIGARYYIGIDPKDELFGRLLPYGWIYERYQRIFEFGWHDLWVTSRARLAFGDVQFHDEENAAELFRGVFGDVFVRKDGEVGVEFRFSLNRDILKLSLFTNVAVFGEVCRTGFTTDPANVCFNAQKNDEKPRIGISGGPGLHALIQGMFQMDLYISFGLLSTGRTAVAFVALLNKTY